MFQDRQVHTSEINFLILNPEFLFCEAGTDEISRFCLHQTPAFLDPTFPTMQVDIIFW